MNAEILKEVVTDILRNIPYRPFLCLPLSATLYAILKDNYNIDARFVTGDLSYKGGYIFKQDFKISDAKDNTYQDWEGHAWVEIGDLICDLSFFRTLYSDKFTKPFKQELIARFGEGKGCLIATQTQMNLSGLSYCPIDYLSDDQATGIIKGFDSLLKTSDKQD